MKELKFKNGLAFIVLDITERASEYGREKLKYHVKVVFNTKEAIKRFAEVVGTETLSKKKKKWLLDNKINGRPIDCEVELDYKTIEYFNQPIWYDLYGITYDYMNTYTDNYVVVKIPTTQNSLDRALRYDEEFKEHYETLRIGSCASGQSLKDFIKEIIKSKRVVYYR